MKSGLGKEKHGCYSKCFNVPNFCVMMLLGVWKNIYFVQSFYLKIFFVILSVFQGIQRFWSFSFWSCIYWRTENQQNCFSRDTVVVEVSSVSPIFDTFYCLGYGNLSNVFKVYVFCIFFWNLSVSHQNLSLSLNIVKNAIFYLILVIFY